MVRRLLSLLSADVSGVHSAAYLLALSTLASQVLALFRDRLLASTFGAGLKLDIYYAAFRVQDFLFFSIASLVSLAVLIPILVHKIEEGKGATKAFLDSVFSAFFIAIIIFGGILALCTPMIVPVIFPGLLGKGLDGDLFFLTRLLLLSPLILGLSNLIGSVVQSYRKFFIYALSPVLYNLGIIIGILFFYPLFGLKGLGLGVLLGALFHLGIQVPFILSEGLFPRLTLSINLTELKRVVALSLPRTFTLSLNQIAMLVLVGFASVMAPGSISVLSFAFNLQSVPVAIIGASYSVAAFPVLAKHFLDKKEKEFSEHFTTALKHIIFWSFPALVAFIVLRAQIVRVILGSGSFSWDDTRLTAACLALFAVSIVAQNLSLLFVRAFYAAGDTKKPLIVSVASSLSIVLFALWGSTLFSGSALFRDFLEGLLRVPDVAGTEVLILPLSYALGSCINLGLFWVVFSRFLSRFSFQVGKTAFHSFAASIFMGLVTYECLEYLGRVFDLNTFSGVFLQGAISALVGGLCLIFMLSILRNEEFFEILKTLKRRVFKVEVIQTEETL